MSSTNVDSGNFQLWAKFTTSEKRREGEYQGHKEDADNWWEKHPNSPQKLCLATQVVDHKLCNLTKAQVCLCKKSCRKDSSCFTEIHFTFISGKDYLFNRTKTHCSVIWAHWQPRGHSSGLGKKPGVPEAAGFWKQRSGCPLSVADKNSPDKRENLELFKDKGEVLKAAILRTEPSKRRIENWVPTTNPWCSRRMVALFCSLFGKRLASKMRTPSHLLCLHFIF